jgi:hypothetical protein
MFHLFPQEAQSVGRALIREKLQSFNERTPSRLGQSA